MIRFTTERNAAEVGSAIGTMLDAPAPGAPAFQRMPGWALEPPTPSPVTA
jgi:hypothetical protein